MEVPPDLQFVGRKEKERKEREKRKRGGGSTVALRHLWNIEVCLLARSDSPREVCLPCWRNSGTVERRNSENLGWYSQETREEERDRKVEEDKKRCECEEEWKWREDCEKNLRNHSKLSEEDKPAAGHHSCIVVFQLFFSFLSAEQNKCSSSCSTLFHS